MKPYGNRLLVKPSEKQEGAFLDSTDSVDEKTGVAVVVSSKAHDINVGDTVYHSKYEGNLIVRNGEKLMFLDVDKVLGVE